MESPSLFHFSDAGDILVFHPRPPLAHPEVDPGVWAIEAWHSPIYFFPRNVARIAVYPTDATTEGDLAFFQSLTLQMMLLFVDQSQAEAHAAGGIWRYRFDPPHGFVNCRDHGCWVSRRTETPTLAERIENLPEAICEAGCELRVASNLLEESMRWFNSETGSWTTTLHVSMVRMSVLEGSWMKGNPVMPP